MIIQRRIKFSIIDLRKVHKSEIKNISFYKIPVDFEVLHKPKCDNLLTH